MSFGVDAAQGFVEETPLLSHTSNSKIGHYKIASAYNTNIFTGDPVKLIAAGVIAIGIGGAIDAQRAVAGVFKGVVYPDANKSNQYFPYWPAGTVIPEGGAVDAYVIDDPFVEFSIQAGTSNAGTHTATVNQADMHQNANFVIGAGTTRNGLSTTYLDMATLTAGDAGLALNCKLIRLTPSFGFKVSATPGTATNSENTFGDLYNEVVVTFNNHHYKGGTGTAGI